MTGKIHYSNPLLPSYLAAVKNSQGAKIFRDFYMVTASGRLKNVTQAGKLSCAYFVSGLLKMFGLIDRLHLTVTGAELALQRAGWKLIKRPRVGSVLIWEEKKFAPHNFHRHIGFYVGRGQAISNNYSSGLPQLHYWLKRFKVNGVEKRKVVAIYWHKKLNQ